MSRTTKLLLVIASMFALNSLFFAQSGQKQKKVITNDDIPSVADVQQSPDEKSSSTDKTAKNDDASKSGEAKTEGESSESSKSADTPAREKASGDAEAKDGDADPASKEKEWKDRFAEQQENVAKLEKEHELADREYKLRAAVFYADAGARLRDDKKWADEERKHKDEMSKLDADIKAAKEKLDSIRENARKAGVKVD